MKNYFVPLAIVAGLMIGAAAEAGTRIIVTRAGCSSEFKGSKSMKKTCVACVKSRKKFRKNNKGVWYCK